MHTMPLTIGVALIAILINLPIPGLSDFLASSGLTAAGNEVIAATMSLLAIYCSFLISYQYAKDDGMNPLTAGVMSMGAFLILVPSTIDMGEAGTITAFKSNYLGSDGIFVAIILSILVAMAYGFLTRKNIKVTLPDSVPPMVSDSLSPVFTAMIIYILDRLLGLNVFGSTDSSKTTETAEAVATSSSTIIDRFFAWFESHYDWSVLLIFSLLILPTYIVFRRAPRQTRHSLPQGFFIQVFNSVLFLVLVFLFSILKYPLMLGDASDDLLMCVSLVIFAGQVVVVYRQLFGYSLRGTLWRMLPLLGLTIIELTILAVIASLIVGAAENDHKPWVYVVFGIVFIALVAISFKIFAVVFTKRLALTAGQRRWQKVVMGLLCFGFVVNTAMLLRIAYVDITGNYSKDTTLSDSTLTFMSIGLTIISAAAEALMIYMIRRLHRMMRK